jgi:hypothetical protein
MAKTPKKSAAPKEKEWDLSDVTLVKLNPPSGGQSSNKKQKVKVKVGHKVRCPDGSVGIVKSINEVTGEAEVDTI